MGNKLSVYSCLFNPDSDLYDLKGAITNWLHYGDEVVIGVLASERDRCEEVIYNALDIEDFERVILTTLDAKKDDPLFTGNLKNAGLQACNNEVVINQDFDERMGGARVYWEKFGEDILSNNHKAVMLPVIDLFGDIDHYKGIGQKWYIHEKRGTFRGPVAFAKRADGTIDTDKSDTCELIDEEGNLVSFIAVDQFNVNWPHVIHLGHVDLRKRAQTNKEFWRDYWSLMNGKDSGVEVDEEKLAEEEVFAHNLSAPWWK